MGKVPKVAYIIGFSAFFADMGYQGAIAILPIFLIFVLHVDFYIFGIIEAFIYGFGALFSYIGGKLSDIYGPKKISITGNSLIPLLSFTGFTYVPLFAVALFSSGWWMRNLRSPARRSLLAGNVEEDERTPAFGVLHGLDVGGGVVSIVILVILVLLHFTYRYLFLFSIIPLIISTLILVPVKENTVKPKPKKKSEENTREAKLIFEGILIGTLLFGFASYSMGFPIITISETYTGSLSLKIIAGVISYGIFLGISSLTGFLLSKKKQKNETSSLGIYGYMLWGAGTFGFAISLIYSLGLAGFYASMFITAIAFGFVETFEPSIVSKIRSSKSIGSSFGILSSSRSIGFFIANIVMGILYEFRPSYSYIYGGIISVAGGIVILIVLKLSKRTGIASKAEN